MMIDWSSKMNWKFSIVTLGQSEMLQDDGTQHLISQIFQIPQITVYDSKASDARLRFNLFALDNHEISNIVSFARYRKCFSRKTWKHLLLLEIYRDDSSSWFDNLLMNISLAGSCAHPCLGSKFPRGKLICKL